MMSVKANVVIWVSLLSLLICLLVGTSMATAETITVPAGQIISRNVNLNAEDEVSGRISVLGGESEGVNFTVTGPSDQVVLPSQRVIVADFKFSASEKGTYLFIFDNSLSSVDKTVSFNYDVKHYWFGMPQEVFLMIIVVLVGALALVVYAMASKG
jgi:hypothetical protein